MSTQHFKFVIIGGGSAGYAAARTALEYHNSIAIVDNSEALGGLCILRGCMPSKTLIYSAEVLHLAQNGDLFGLDIPEAKVNMQALHERKHNVIHEFASYRQNQLANDSFTLFRTSGHFINENTLQLSDGKKLTAEKFLIATGSIINTPPLPGLQDTPFITSDDVLELDYLPKSILILGGGVIACELSQFLSRIGSKVIQIQRSPHILKETPVDSATVIEDTFRAEGIELFTDTAITSIRKENNEIHVTFTHHSQEITRKAPVLFNALGRIPNTASLKLQNAGVKLLSKGHVDTNKHQQSSNPIIYAAGDCAGPHEIVHVAILQGECATHHAFQSESSPQKSHPINYNHLLKIIFTDPQIANVGLAENDLEKQNIPFLSASYPFDDHGKSILMEAKRGFVKILANPKDGHILGAECASKDASELIHALSVAISLNATVFDLLKTHWYHPTLSEIWSYPLEEIADAIPI